MKLFRFGRRLAALGTAIGLGSLTARVIWGILWAHQKLQAVDVDHSLATDFNQLFTGLTFSKLNETASAQISHTIENGLERIVYLPKQRRYQTPLLMQHGMWHNARCWQLWQELFAEWGWESIAVSLPGHGGSPEQRPIPECTLDYYLSFLQTEVKRLPNRPVLMGHSMGGALAQWYLKYVADNLPAVVLVAPWVAKNALVDGLPLFLRSDPYGLLLMACQGSATPFVRSPQVAARLLISKRAILSPTELYTQLGPESGLVMFQHQPPGWIPPEEIQTPMLVLAGSKDAVVSSHGLRKTAGHYKADFRLIPEAGHNLMHEHNYRTTAEKIHTWLKHQSIL